MLISIYSGLCFFYQYAVHIIGSVATHKIYSTYSATQLKESPLNFKWIESCQLCDYKHLSFALGAGVIMCLLTFLYLFIEDEINSPFIFSLSYFFIYAIIWLVISHRVDRRLTYSSNDIILLFVYDFVISIIIFTYKFYNIQESSKNKTIKSLELEHRETIQAASTCSWIVIAMLFSMAYGSYDKMITRAGKTFWDDPNMQIILSSTVVMFIIPLVGVILGIIYQIVQRFNSIRREIKELENREYTFVL